MIHTVEFRAMGSRILAAIDSASASAAERLGRVAGWFESWEQSLSRFREDSELSRLNRSLGEPFQASPTIMDVFEAALAAERLSGGLVTPLVHDALVSAGYAASFERLGERGTVNGAASLPPVPALRAVEYDLTRRSLRLPTGAHLDFGGVAKGWAAHQALLRLKPYGPALVDAGGDIAISGRQESGEAWPVAVEDPFHPGEQLELLILGRCGVATSGVDYRRWKQGGVWRHHLIDPRTNLPAETDVWSATVVAPTLPEAETAAKMVVLLGSQEGLQWLEAHPAWAGLVVLQDGRRINSRRMEAYTWREA